MNVRIALVGTGSMAEYHYRKFSAIPGVDITACADHRESKAGAFAAKYGIPRSFDRIGALLDATGCEKCPGTPGRAAIDAVSCAVVDRHHPRIAIACLERGIPLFCEKPMARTLTEALRMESARAPGLPVVVNFSKRNAPALVALAKLVRDGSLGTIREIDASYSQSWLATGAWGDWRTSTTRRWRLSPTESTAGVLGDLGSHLVDAILAVTGGRIVDPILVDALDFRGYMARSGGAAAGDADDSLLGPWMPGDEERDGRAGEPCPALVEFSATATLSDATDRDARSAPLSGGCSGGISRPDAGLDGCGIRISATFVDPKKVDAFAIAVRGSFGSARMDLGVSRTAVELETAGGRAWIEGARMPSTYEAFVSRLRGEDAAEAGLPWMRAWPAPSFTDGLEVQKVLEVLMDQARARHGATR